MSDERDVKRIQVEIPSEAHRRLKIFSASRETRISDVVREALNLYLRGKGLTDINLNLPEPGGWREKGQGDE